MWALHAAVSCVLLVAPVLGATREQTRLQVATAKGDPSAAFRNWAVQQGKDYLGDAEEFDHRFAIWKDNLDYVHHYNSEHSTHWLALNAHADLTHEEFQQHRLGFDYAAFKERRASQVLKGTYAYTDVDHKSLPHKVDWREKGAVSHVKNQERCGSCWAFSTTGAIEGVNAIYTGELEVVSEQELIDCDTKHDHGCMGGLMDTAFEFVVKNGGIDTEKDYSYHAEEGSCSINRRNRDVVTIDDYDDVPHEEEEELRKAVAHQPIATAIQANERPFQLYGGGVFTDDCGTALDHGVLIVGYGRENHTDYWLIKNSWGEAWGDEGYIKLERGHEHGAGKCGLAIAPSFPIKKHDNPPRPPKPSPDPAPPPAPAPTPVPPQPHPVVCDSTTECYPGTTCCCMQQVAQMCLEWACCPIPEATCCKDHVHCCPKELPKCDVEHGRCLPGDADTTDNFDGILTDIKSAPIVKKVPAIKSWFRGLIRTQE